MTTISEATPQAVSRMTAEARARQSLRQKTYPRQLFLTYQRQIVGQDVGAPDGADLDQPMTFETWLGESEAQAG